MRVGFGPSLIYILPLFVLGPSSPSMSYHNVSGKNGVKKEKVGSLNFLLHGSRKGAKSGTSASHQQA